MGVLFGLIAALACSIIAACATMMLGFRDGDLPGDARVTVRVVPDRAADSEGGVRHTAFAEIVVENGHDSPVLVSARARRASALTLAFAASHSRHTALAHRRGLDGVEVLGAVDGRGIRRYLLPLDSSRSATRVTVVVDQAARRTRVTTATLRAAAAHPLRRVAPRDAADA